MRSIDVLITSEQGLHAKPADLFVRAANKYASNLSIMNITKNSEFKNAKSILQVLSLGIYKNHRVRIQADGIDEKQAIKGLSYLLKTDFVTNINQD